MAFVFMSLFAFYFVMYLRIPAELSSSARGQFGLSYKLNGSGSMCRCFRNRRRSILISVNSLATTNTSSSQPMNGRKSGIKSKGISTYSTMAGIAMIVPHGLLNVPRKTSFIMCRQSVNRRNKNRQPRFDLGMITNQRKNALRRAFRFVIKPLVCRRQAASLQGLIHNRPSSIYGALRSVSDLCGLTKCTARSPVRRRRNPMQE